LEIAKPMTMKVMYVLARLVAAVIMLQTLYFKFTAAPESVYIFTAVGMEPWGRYVVGTGELIASILLLLPRKAWLGGLMAVGLMAGALFFHLTKIGYEVMGDGGQLFWYAAVVTVCGGFVTVYNKSLILEEVLPRLKGR
jgi:putative oxidoreductase